MSTTQWSVNTGMQRAGCFQGKEADSVQGIWLLHSTLGGA